MAAYNADQQQFLIYFYDLPKQVCTSVRIAEIVKEKTGIILNYPTTFKRSSERFFDSAIVKVDTVDSVQKFMEACEKLKYFEVEGKMCRALPYDRDILGQNRQKLNEKNVFVKKLPKEMKVSELDQFFSQYGRVKSAKISLNKDHESNQYGFVFFEDIEQTKRAIEATRDNQEIIGQTYLTKDKKELQKIFNNIYVKNFPVTMEEPELRQIFEQFGEISSMKLMKNENGATAFICYGKEGEDKVYGLECAQRAVKEMHGKRIDDKSAWYAKPALSKQEREIEKKKDMMRYKNSKKRCNLYVKNFPPETTKQQLEEVFQKFGAIENIRIFPQEQEAKYAFVCFNNPESAQKAKADLNQQNFNGRMLYINHYEIKEVRKAQYEEMHDKQDFNNYKKQNSQLSMDFINKPEIFTLLNHLISMIQPRMNNNKNMQRPPRAYSVGNRQPAGPNMMRPPQMPPMMQPGQMIPNAMPQQMAQMGLPQPNPMMMGAGQPPMAQMSYAQAYLFKARNVIPALSIQNPNYKVNIGEMIYEYVEKLAGEDKAPKITGMLIDLPLDECRAYLMDYAKLQEKVNEASQLLV